MEIKKSFKESLALLETIPHSSCRKAIKKNWIAHANGKIKAHSMCWLYCWAETGMGSKDAEMEAKKVFEIFFGESSFLNFDTHVGPEWARWARYKRNNIHIDSQLASKLNEKFNEDIEIAFAKSQGFQLDPKKRKIIELFAMEKAKKEYEELGYNVIDHSKNHPYDLYCIKESDEIFIEVKGTQTLGEEIILTKNEVKFAKENKEKMVLYIVSTIKINDKNEIINDGIINKKYPWDIENEKGELIPISYTYCLPITQK